MIFPQHADVGLSMLVHARSYSNNHTQWFKTLIKMWPAGFMGDPRCTSKR